MFAIGQFFAVRAEKSSSSDAVLITDKSGK
jgi:hypothetical protein